jgi:protein-arginine kinase activator protein McsA
MDCNQAKASIHFTSVDNGSAAISLLCPACFSKRSNGFNIDSCLCEYCGATAQMAARAPIHTAFGLWPNQDARRELLCDNCYMTIMGYVARRISQLQIEGLNPNFLTVTEGMIESVRKSVQKRRN